MIGGWISLAAATLAVLGADPSTSRTYDIHVTVSQDGKVLAKPRLLGRAGEVVTFMSMADDKGYTLKVVATPGSAASAGADGVSLALDLVVQPSAHDRSRVTTTVVTTAGHDAAIEIPARAGLPATRVEISARGV